MRATITAVAVAAAACILSFIHFFVKYCLDTGHQAEATEVTGKIWHAGRAVVDNRNLSATRYCTPINSSSSSALLPSSLGYVDIGLKHLAERNTCMRAGEGINFRRSKEIHHHRRRGLLKSLPCLPIFYLLVLLLNNVSDS